MFLMPLVTHTTLVPPLLRHDRDFVVWVHQLGVCEKIFFFFCPWSWYSLGFSSHQYQQNLFLCCCLTDLNCESLKLIPPTFTIWGAGFTEAASYRPSWKLTVRIKLCFASGRCLLVRCRPFMSLFWIGPVAKLNCYREQESITAAEQKKSFIDKK